MWRWQRFSKNLTFLASSTAIPTTRRGLAQRSEMGCLAGYSYLITEIRAGGPAASRSWQLKNGRSGFLEEKIEENILES